MLEPHRFISRLDDSPLAERWLTLHEEAQTSHVVYLFPACHDNAERRKFLSAAEPLASVDQSHLLKLEAYGFTPEGRPWLVTPYPGTHDGLLTLLALSERKPQNRMEPPEVERVATHLLEPIAACHEAGLHNGPLDERQVLVDPRGAVLIEQYGFARRFDGLGAADANVVIDEIRSVVELTYRLLTGVEAKAPLIPAGKLVRRLPLSWSNWLERGLDPAGGFASAEEALAELPSRGAPTGEAAVPASRVRTVWKRVRRLTR